MKGIVIAALLSAFVVVSAVAFDFNLGTQFDLTNISGGGGSSGLGGPVGYAISRNLSVEVEYNRLDSVSDISGMTFEHTAFGPSGVYSYPINEQISVLGKLGFLTVTTSASQTCFITSHSDASLGFGVQHNFDKAISIRVGFDHYKVTGSSLNSMYI